MKSLSKAQIKLFVLVLLSAAVYVLLGYFTVRSDFQQLIFCYSLAFVLYFLIYRLCATNDFFLTTILAAVLFRTLLLFYLPNLSDDFYRFVWDGRLIVQGINPYQFLPSEIMQDSILIMDASLFNNLNSQNFYSVYPPASQAIFFICSFLFPTSIFWNVVALKVSMLLFEIGTLFLLYRLVQSFQLKKEIILLYALNPLVIIEPVGNIHFEAGMIFFMLLAVFLAMRGNTLLSAGSLALAIMIKLLPLIFIPFFYLKLGAKGFLKFVLFIALFLSLFLFPLWDLVLIKNFMASVTLYFNHFSFNASSYYLARWVAAWFNVYELPWFKILTPVFLGITILFFFVKQKKEIHEWFFSGSLFTLTVYFLFATTIHPWYIIPLIAFTVFTKFRFAIVWSALVPLTYVTYSTVPYQENFLLIGLEYFVVAGMFVYEISSKQFINSTIKDSNPIHIINRIFR